MNKAIILERPNKQIYIQDNKVYKSFEENYNIGDILNEALNQARVYDVGLNIPRLLGVSTVDNRWAIIMEYIEGQTIEQLINTNPNKIDYYLNKFVDIQIDMQTKRCPLLSKHRDKMNRKIATTSLSSTLRYDLHNRIEAMPHNIDLCHGDYSLSNVLINNNGEAYILDWSHATQGNKEADCARSFLLFLLENQNGYAKKYIDLYCEKIECDHMEILKWLPILAASQSVKSIVGQHDLLNELIFLDEEGLQNLYEKI